MDLDASKLLCRASVELGLRTVRRISYELELELIHGESLPGMHTALGLIHSSPKTGREVVVTCNPSTACEGGVEVGGAPTQGPPPLPSECEAGLG